MTPTKNPALALQQIFSQFGSDLLQDRQKLIGLILDYFGGDRLALLLIKSIDEGVLDKILELGGSQADPLTLSHLEKSLHEKKAWDKDFARQVVETWQKGLEGLLHPSSPIHPPDQSSLVFQGIAFSPILEKVGMEKQWGKGQFITGFGIDQDHLLLVFTGGIGIFRKGNALPLGWIVTAVVSAALSPNALLLAVGLPNGAIELWKINEGHCSQMLELHESSVRTLEFSEDGRFLASGDETGKIVLWETISGWPARQWESTDGAVLSLAFKPGSDQLISASSRGIVQNWHLASGDLLGVLPVQSQIFTMAFSSNGRFLAMGDNRQRLFLWNWGSEFVARHIGEQSDSLRRVRFLSDNRLISISDQTINVWEIPDSRLMMRRDAAAFKSLDAIVLPQDDILIVETDGLALQVWADEGQTPWLTIEKEFEAVGKIAFSPRDEMLAFADGRKIQLIHYHDGRQDTKLEKHRFEILDLAFSPDGRYLISCAADGILHLWDAVSRKPLRLLWKHNDWLNTVSFAPDGSKIAVGGEDALITLFSLPEGKKVRQWLTQSAVKVLAYMPDGRRLAAGGEDGSVTIWSSERGEKIFSERSCETPVTAAAVSANGHWLVSGYEDGTIQIFNLSKGMELHYRKFPNRVTGIAIHPKRDLLAVGCGDGSVWFFLPDIYDQDQRLKVDIEPVNALAFSPSGDLLAVACGGCKIMLFGVNDNFYRNIVSLPRR